MAQDMPTMVLETPGSGFRRLTVGLLDALAKAESRVVGVMRGRAPDRIEDLEQTIDPMQEQMIESARRRPMDDLRQLAAAVVFGTGLALAALPASMAVLDAPLAHPGAAAERATLPQAGIPYEAWADFLDVADVSEPWEEAPVAAREDRSVLPLATETSVDLRRDVAKPATPRAIAAAQAIARTTGGEIPLPLTKPTPPTQEERVGQAIMQAGMAFDVPFSYMAITGHIESGLNPKAANRHSSARGLYQFTNQTWLLNLWRHADIMGRPDLKEGLVRGGDGIVRAVSPEREHELLRLRIDPATAALVHAARTHAVRGNLKEWLGRDPSDVELYLAHFLGRKGSQTFLRRYWRDPNAPVTAEPGLRYAVRSNPGLFRDAAGRPASFATVMRHFETKFAHEKTVVKDLVESMRAGEERQTVRRAVAAMSADEAAAFQKRIVERMDGFLDLKQDQQTAFRPS